MIWPYENDQNRKGIYDQMNYAIDPEKREAAYLQLYRLLVRDVVSGAYPYGSRLPSKRLLAAEASVSVVTAEHAVSLLCEEGYAEARERSGCFVIYRASDFPGRPMTEAPGLPPLPQLRGGGDFPFSVLAKTMRRVLLDYGERIMVKSPNHGCPELREAICAYLGRSRGIRVAPGQVIVGSGAEYLYGLIAQLFGPGSAFALEKPSYEKIRRVYESMGMRCELLPLAGDGIPSRELERTEARVLHVTPFHSFPSGVSADISKKREYLRWAAEREGFLVEDNYDSELTVSRKAEDSLFALAEGRRVIYLNTFSKTISPSMRMGYMVLPEELTEEFGARLGFYSCPVPLFEQYVLSELLRTGDYERHLNRVRRKKRREKEAG